MGETGPRLSEEDEERLRDVVDRSIDYAEQKARQFVRGRGGGKKLEGQLKLDHAVTFAAREIRRRKIPEAARDHLVDLIAARLGERVAEAEGVR